MDLVYAVITMGIALYIIGYLADNGDELLEKPVEWLAEILWPEE